MKALENKIELFPVPRKITTGSDLIQVPADSSISLTGIGDNPDLLKIVEDWAAGKNYSIKTDAIINLNITQKKEMNYSYIDPLKMYSEEPYEIDLFLSGKKIMINIVVSGARGLFNSLATLGQLLGKRSIPSCKIQDYPCFSIRAVIEGYYGSPWSQEERMSMLKLLSEYKFNAYFYSPKDDIYHREKWRELYPEAILEDLKELVEKTSELGLDFWYNIGPGLSMKYSSEKDFSDLIQKYEQLYSIGIRRFGLLFDDIPDHLQHIEDQEMFADISSAHVAVANRVYHELVKKDPSIQFVVCPTQYWGKGTEYYISNMGSKLDPRIELYWTGPEICSRELTLSDAGVFARQTNRPVLYWDNYPVNDLEMANEMHIGPYFGRDSHLYRSSVGIVANAMEYAESSKIPLITIGAYLWNPEQYEPESTWTHALRRIAGDDDFDSFYVFADNSRYSCLYPTDSPYLKKVLSQFEFEYKYGDQKKALSYIGKAVDHLNQAVELFNRGMNNRKLSSEIKRWSSKFVRGVKLLEDTISYLSEKDKDKLKTLKINFDAYQSDNTYIFSDVLYPFIDAALKE